MFYRSGGETVRTCHRFTDRHGTGTASRTRRDCPADCPARSRQTVRQTVRRGRLPQIGNGCRLSGEPVRRDRHRRRTGTPQGAAADRDGREPVRHGRTQWRAVAARFRRLCPRPVRQTVRRAMRMYAYAMRMQAGTRRTVAPVTCPAHLSGRPCGTGAARSDADAARLSEPQTVRRERLRRDRERGERLPRLPIVRRTCHRPARSPQAAHRNATDGAADRTRRGCRIVSTRIKSRCKGTASRNAARLSGANGCRRSGTPANGCARHLSGTGGAANDIRRTLAARSRQTVRR